MRPQSIYSIARHAVDSSAAIQRPRHQLPPLSACDRVGEYTHSQQIDFTWLRERCLGDAFTVLSHPAWFLHDKLCKLVFLASMKTNSLKKFQTRNSS